MFTHVDLPRLPEADFEVGGRHYGVFGHDWRVRPPMSWLSLLGEREMATSGDAQTRPAVTALVLSEPEFTVAVRDALRGVTRADALQNNPLLRSRLVLEVAGAGEPWPMRVEALRSLLLGAASGLQVSPRQQRQYDA